jgi:hypothetical protein
LFRASPGVESSRVSAWDAIAGWSSARWPGSAASAAFRRLTVRYERRADIHQAFLSLGCSLICWKTLNR